MNSFWHGTASIQAGQSILNDRILRPVPDGKYRKRSTAIPIPGKVYITNDPMYAGIYAMGGEYWGHKHSNPKGYGYLFRVIPSVQARLTVDEDQLGELAASGRLPWLSRIAQGLGGTYRKKWDGTLWRAAHDGEYEAWIVLGKALHRSLSSVQMADILPFATQFAVDGDVLVAEAWLLQYSQTVHIHDSESLFENAVRIKYVGEQRCQ